MGKFFTDTKDLRKQMFVKRAEKKALLHSRTPDAEAITKITGELFDLKTTLQEKATEAGVPKHFHEGGSKHHRGWQFSQKEY